MNTNAMKGAQESERQVKKPIPVGKSYTKVKLSRNLDDSATQMPILRSTLKNTSANIDFVTKPMKYFTQKFHSTPKKNKTSILKIEDSLTYTTELRPSPFTSHVVSDQEIDYINVIDSYVKTWLESTPLPQHIGESEINTIAEKLTNDIVDRKRYFQVSGSEDHSRKDDLNYLKLQVFRRIHSLLQADELKPVIKGTDNLLDKVDNVKVPLLSIKLRDKTTSTLDVNYQSLQDSLTKIDSRSPRASSLLNQLQGEGVLEKETSNKKKDPTTARLEKKFKDELTDIAHKGDGDIEKERKNLVKKIMRETGLPEDEAKKMADKMIDNAKEKEKTAARLEENFADDLANIARKGDGDIEKERKDLVKKIIRETGLPEDEANELADKMIDKAKEKEKTAARLEKKFAGELTDIARKGDGDIEKEKKDLVKKIMRETGMTEDEANNMADKIIDKAKEKELTAARLEDKFKDELTDIARKGDDDTEKERKNLVKKIMRETGLPEDEAKKMADKMIDKAKEKELIAARLGENFADDLANIVRKGDGDIEKDRKNLVKKIMRETGMTEDDANEMADKMIDNAKEKELTAARLEEEFTDELTEIARKGSDIESGRQSLIDKLMQQDPNLSEFEAAVLADQLIDRAREKVKRNGSGTETTKHKSTATPGGEIGSIKSPVNVRKARSRDDSTETPGGLIENGRRKSSDRPSDLSSYQTGSTRDETTSTEEEPDDRRRRKSQTLLNKEIADILGKHNITGEKAKELQAALLDEIDKLTRSGASPDEILKTLIETIKKNTGMSDKEAEQLAHEILGATEKANEKGLKDAALQDYLRGVFHGCPMSEKNRKLMEEQLKEQYAKDFGIELHDSDFKIKPTDPATLESHITAKLNNWLKKLPMTINNKQEFDNNKKDFISKLKNMLPASDFRQIYEETKNYMHRLPLNPDIRDDEEFLDKKAKELVDNLVSPRSGDDESHYGMSYNGLTDYIENWFDSLHISDDTKREDEIKNMKKHMANDLIHKIGEMNVDPEIFNDDFLYEHILRDELQNLLADVTVMDENIQELKEDLIEKIKDAQHRAYDETVGQTYKQKLRDAISNILPDSRTLSKDEQAVLETMKDQLADAYIDLHYSGVDENVRDKLKRKIANEIDTFCNDYLNRHPETPLNNQRLQRDLYNALNNVPLPSGDSIRYEVEQARIREEINDWVKELPLQPQSPAELFARNKLIYILAKKLFDIEAEANPSERDPLMRKEIVKFLNKMPLKPGQNNNILADKLIERLKNTEASRKFNASKNVTLDSAGNVTSLGAGGSSAEDSVCPYYKSMFEKRRSSVSGQPSYRRPKCTLTPEDIDHLERIRRRICLAPKCVKSLIRYNKRNTGVGPRPMDAGSQTDLRPGSRPGPSQESPICPVANAKAPRPCPGVPVGRQTSPICPAANDRTPRPCPGAAARSSRQSPCHSRLRKPTISSSNLQKDGRDEVQPKIIVKEYYWDPSSNTQESDSPQLDRIPCHQSDGSSSPTPCHQSGTSPCMTSGSPCRQSNASPYQPRGPPQQSPSPHRVPCDHTFSPNRQSPDRYSQWSPKSCSPERMSRRSNPCPRSPYSQSPCMSPMPSPFRPPHQSTPFGGSAGYSFKRHDCGIPKRNGLQDPIPSTSSGPSRKERVIELGSLDDLRSPRPKKRNTGNFDWSYTKSPEEENAWGSCMRRVVLDEGIDDSLLMDTPQREERVSCKCKDKNVSKCPRARPRACHRRPFSYGNEDGNNLDRCSKCCGLSCPYPSYLYFR